MSTLALQSLHDGAPGWLGRCLGSVRDWAAAQGHAYRFIGDELFDPIPQPARAACRGATLPLTDLGRLLWMRRLHEEGWDRVIWLDADVLVLDPTLRIDGEGVGREAWISRAPGGGFRALPGVNNCAMSFAAGSPLLARYLAAALEAAEGLTAAPHPRALGPDLLLRLHRAAPFPLIPDIAMLSPLVLGALDAGDPAPAAAHDAVWAGPVRAANLCGSLADHRAMARIVERLAAAPGLLRPGGAATVEIVTEAKNAPPPWPVRFTTAAQQSI